MGTPVLLVPVVDLLDALNALEEGDLDRVKFLLTCQFEGQQDVWRKKLKYAPKEEDSD